jgi:hypothetical protein
MFFSTGIEIQYTENLAGVAGGPHDRPRLICDLRLAAPVDQHGILPDTPII